MNARIDPAELVRNFCEGVYSPGYPDRVGHYMYTFTGRLFWPCDPRPEEVDIEDIATALSRICRFGGHSTRTLTVAEHCLLVSENVPRELALEGLLHDAAEAYVGDQIRPIKSIPAMGKVYLPIEHLVERAIAQRFQLRYPWPIEIKRADEIAQNTEVAGNITSKAHNPHADEKLGMSRVKLQFYAPELARLLFLARFKELTKERGL